MSATRLAWSTAAAAALGWGILAACGSSTRPPPAETGSDAGRGGDDAGGDFDGGSFVPGTTSGGPCFDEEVTTPLPDIGFTVTADAATGCTCEAQTQKGLMIAMPCSTSLCARGFDGMWDCTKDGKFHFYRGGGVGTTCDAATIPSDAAPCTAPR